MAQRTLGDHCDKILPRFYQVQIGVAMEEEFQREERFLTLAPLRPSLLLPAPSGLAADCHSRLGQMWATQ